MRKKSLLLRSRTCLLYTSTKDYIFDIDRFTSFEGNTGPYILYTIVRIKSILNRFTEEGGNLEEGAILDPVNDSQKNLMLQLTGFGATVENAFEEMCIRDRRIHWIQMRI